MAYGHAPPHDKQAEIAVLSSILFDNKVSDKAFEVLIKSDFYSPSHQAVYKAMQALANDSKTIDLVTLQDKMKQQGTFETSGGIENLSDISSHVSTGAKIDEYVEILKDSADRRKLVANLTNAIHDTRENKPLDEAINSVEQTLIDLEKGTVSEESRTLADIVPEWIQDTEDKVSGKKQTGIKTGFVDLDNRLGGFQDTDLIYIAARPSMGKTALALNIASHMAFKEDSKALIFSLEMSQQQLVSRLFSSEGLFDYNKLVQQRATKEEQSEKWEKISSAASQMNGENIIINDQAKTFREIRSIAKSEKRSKDIDIIFIDYLQLMELGNRSESRQQEVSSISRNLKSLARELGVPIVVLSQLSRACEQRADMRPILSDLRESGSIEQDADVVTFIYRDEYYHPDTDRKGITELNVAKNRNGSTGLVELGWWGQYTRFVNLDRRYKE